MWIISRKLFATKSGEVILHYGFRYGFLAAGIGIILGEIIFITLSPKYLAHVGEIKREKIKKMLQKKRNL